MNTVPSGTRSRRGLYQLCGDRRLGNSNPRARHDVAVMRDRNLDWTLAVAAVRVVATNVEIYAARARDGARRPQGPALFRG